MYDVTLCRILQAGLNAIEPRAALTAVDDAALLPLFDRLASGPAIQPDFTIW